MLAYFVPLVKRQRVRLALSDEVGVGPGFAQGRARLRGLLSSVAAFPPRRALGGAGHAKLSDCLVRGAVGPEYSLTPERSFTPHHHQSWTRPSGARTQRQWACLLPTQRSSMGSRLESSHSSGSPVTRMAFCSRAVSTANASA